MAVKPLRTGSALIDEQIAQVRDCLKVGKISLQPGCFDCLVHKIEASMAVHAAEVRDGHTFRQLHDELRGLSLLVRKAGPPVGQVRTRINALSAFAAEYMQERWSRVRTSLFPYSINILDFRAWSQDAMRDDLIRAVAVLAADGAQLVPGRSRGHGRRSRPRIESVILGKSRGKRISLETGGRPREDANFRLVMHLALDWHIVTGRYPTKGRSDRSGFGCLVHAVFQWRAEDEHMNENSVYGSATYALRRYWHAVGKRKPRKTAQPRRAKLHCCRKA